ncbi:leucine-rich repeat-containing protein 15-like isoform X3 [Metopolophium dirhodum]|uniref:leucine-rich repeat-containing protein 15-like isoform X3 n=1 Tax=Metopolophium dirhodum TaxID=44670 RepID=UPI00298F6B78|nr:leucine-rich repeat-containing protein 15-like isoform X3 [Metopolophium dirhodum]
MIYSKFYLLWYVILMCVFLKQVQSSDINLEWGKDCPRACNCKNTDFIDLPIVKWMYNGLQTELEPHTSNTQNEVFEENEEEQIAYNNTHFLKTALCMFMNVTRPKDFLNFLPLDTEALILFQTTDSDNITIEDDIKLPKLISFEIHGNNNQTKIYITDRMFKYMDNIKYVNIQSVSLDKLTLESNEPIPIIDSNVYKKENSYAFNELSPVLPSYLHKEHNDIKNRLIFLQPKDIEIVPYKTYKKTKRTAKSNSLIFINKDLLFLRITNCGLKDISWDLFNGLESLETLILDNNAIEYIPDFSFYGASVLKRLSLANNKIKHLQTTGLAGLLDLNYLNLKNNAITVLSETTFPPLPKLKVADLSDNPIEMVYPHTFEVLNATIELALGSNNTQLHLHKNAFIGLDSLEKLNLIGVNVTILERPFMIGLPNLVELKIKGFIQHIAFDAFVEIPNIKRLLISNCSIQSVSMDSFYGIYNLEHVDLSYNQLQELPPGLFDQQLSLKELILNNNQLIDLPDDIFKTTSNLKLIRLDMNSLHCTCSMKLWDISLMTKLAKEINKQSCKLKHSEKGYSCKIERTTTYIYNKKLEPICSSPTKLKGKTVSYALRKYMNCNSESNSKLYMKKKYKELKLYKQISEQDIKRNISTVKTNFSDFILNNTTSIRYTGPNITMEMIESTPESIINNKVYTTTERSILLKNGTYISKLSLKEEIAKMKRKHKVKNSDFKLENKL